MNNYKTQTQFWQVISAVIVLVLIFLAFVAVTFV